MMFVNLESAAVAESVFHSKVSTEFDGVCDRMCLWFFNVHRCCMIPKSSNELMSYLDSLYTDGVCDSSM